MTEIERKKYENILARKQIKGNSVENLAKLDKLKWEYKILCAQEKSVNMNKINASIKESEMKMIKENKSGFILYCVLGVGILFIFSGHYNITSLVMAILVIGIAVIRVIFG